MANQNNPSHGTQGTHSTQGTHGTQGTQGTQHKVENTLGRAAGEAREKAQDFTDKARQTAANLGDKARDAASNLGDRARDTATAVKDRTDDTLSTVGQKMSSLAGSLRENAPQQGVLGNAASTGADYLQAGGRYLQEHGLDDMGRDVTQLVRSNPLPALFISFGVGCLLGMAMRR